jgi:arsenate reductase
MKKRVLFLCTANSCRSQMAEGLMNHFLGDKIEAFSAGTEASCVNPTATYVMKEIGIDISGHQSKNLTAFDGLSFDYVITLCGNANETCPLYCETPISVTQCREIGKLNNPAQRRAEPFNGIALKTYDGVHARDIGGTKKTHIGFDDPAKAQGTQEEVLREFRRVRDEIKEKLTAFFQAEKIIN